MNSRRKIVNCIVVFALCATLAGCPTGSKWQQAANASDNLIQSVSAAQDLEIGFYHAQLPQITAAEHVRIQQGFKKVAELDKALNAAIKSGSAGGSSAAWQAAMDGINEALAEGVFNVKDPTANLAIQTAVNGSRVLLLSIRDIANK